MLGAARWSGAGAVLRKELLTSLRNPRPFVGLALLLGVLIAVLNARWPEAGFVDIGSRARLARSIFESVRDTAFVLVAFLAPAASAGAVTLEREAQSLELLLVTPIRPAWIVLEKLLSSVAFLLLALVATLPVSTATTFLGGVGADEVALSYAAIAVACVGFAAIGVTASAFAERTFGALVIAYASVLPVALVVLGLLRECGDAATTGVLVFFLIALGAPFVLLLLAAAAVRLSRPPPPPPPPADAEVPILHQSVLWLDRRRFPDWLILPARLGELMSDRANPIYEKEVRFEVFGKGSALVRGMIIAGLLGMLVALLAGLSSAAGSRAGAPILAIYATAFLLVIVPPFAASSIAGERERGTLDLVVTTTIRSRSIVVGKLLGCLRTPLVLGGLLACYAPFAFACGETPAGLARQAAVGLSTIVLGTALTLALSAALGTTLRALVASYASLVAIHLAPVLLAGPLARALGEGPARGLLSLSVLAALTDASGARGSSALLGADAGFLLDAKRLAAWTLVPPWLAHVALAAAATVAIVGVLSAGFDRIARAG